MCSLLQGTTRIYFMLFLIYIKSNHIVSLSVSSQCILLSIATYIYIYILLNILQFWIPLLYIYIYIYIYICARTLAGKLNPYLKANLNGHPSMCNSIQIWIRLKALYFHGKWQNHFIWMINRIYITLFVRNFKINARNKL